MLLNCINVCRHNLTGRTSQLFRVRLNKSAYNLGSVVRVHCKMAKKVNQNKTYVAVNIENAAPKSGFGNVLTKTELSTKKAKVEVEHASGYGRLFQLAKPEKWRLFGAICFLLVSSTVTMAIPFSLGKLLDYIYNSSSDGIEIDANDKLKRLCAILVGVFVIGAICNFGRVYFMATSGYRMTQALRKRVFASIVQQEQGFFDKRSTGELVNRLSADTQVVGQALSSNISDGLRSTVMVCAGTGLMIYMSPQLALVSLAIVPPVVVVAVIYGRFLRGISRKVQDSLADANKVAEERIANMRTVKTFSRESREIQSYGSSINDVLTLSYSEAKFRAIFYGLTGFSGNVIIVSVLYYGGQLVRTGDISIGSLSSFLLYAAYVGISVNGLSTFYSELNKSLGAGIRIWEIMDRKPIIPIKGGVIPIAAPEGHIRFQNIRFSYPSRSDACVFDNLSLEIAPGRTLAVVGPSGSGKSTIAALLLRLYDPDSGTIFLDEQNIKDLDPSWLRQHIGTVSQEPVLFSSSIRDNILYGSEDPESVTESDLLQVAQEANVLEFVQKLPEAFDTVVGERGVLLSGGQKQRVAIARALIKNPKILLLDEATSALDAQSEHLVQEALERIMKGRTVLTIAHRLSTIQNADLIAVLKNGQIVEQGEYRELLGKEQGAFRELMQHQTFQDISQPESPLDGDLKRLSGTKEIVYNPSL